jgi:GNAT superfamily N-acetyltransferase
MRIETIHPEVWPHLHELFMAEFGAIPHASESSVVAAFDGKLLAGLVEVASPVVFGPLYVFPEYRGKGVHRELIEHVESKVPNDRSVYIFAEDPRVGKMCERKGLRLVGGDIYWREANG